MGEIVSHAGRFVVREVGNEVLAYDPETRRMTAMNAFAARVWTAASQAGRRDAIVEALKADGIDADAEGVESALGMLVEAGLIAMPRQHATGTNRRGFLGTLFAGSTAAVAASVVTVVAPTPAHAASSVCGSCPSNKPVCNTATMKCVECLSNTDCHNPLKPICTSFICGTGGIL